jgi:hypothetical protein
MTIEYNNNDYTYDITLDDENLEQEISLEGEEIIGNAREFAVGGTLDGATIKIQRYVSEHVGYVDMLDLNTNEAYAISAVGAGYGLAFYIRKGKIKFVLQNASVNTEAKISIFK